MPSDDISRLYDFVAGTTIVADQVDAEFNQMVTTLNNKVGRATTETVSGTKTFSAGNSHTGNNTFAGNNTFSGQNTFSETTSPIKTDKVVENTAGAGVTLDGCLHLDGNVRLGTIRATVSSIDTGTDTLTSDTHGLSTADPVRIRALSGGTIPAGLSATTVYYARAASATTLTLHPTASDATGNTNKVDITSSGSGTLQVIGDILTPSEGDLWYNNGLKYRHLGNSETLPTAATQSDMETATSTGTYVSPGRQQYHPVAAKAWACVVVSGGTPALSGSYNVSSVADNGVGNYTVNFTTAFSSTTYCPVISAASAGGGNNLVGAGWITRSTTSCSVSVVQLASSLDYNFGSAFFGDQ